MNAKELILGALQYYSIEIIKQENNRIYIGRNYDIEIETNGLYKLRSDGQVIAPFDDVDELCRFVLM
ncbi:MAG: hypothetical protein GTN67_04750 [Hydrotalea flava]|uniref:hypothetical protein n=1 Tax=Hydrotalea lipotrueae TaxID=2803817 RepID=UPI001699F28C|nr:hypothetical protein [Hydrotalea lipotrueae]NIM34749.1 hypothetical protein [Hydrotalea flava]GHT27531.1 hypothetical protein FACS189432_04240 [Bacteroidia bacterium]NIM37585.1 hypothetical protein [Hydrotalea flava]NIN02745.1 hypothetical protein [Hydrotalea flava]NIN14430.1 hypothetical protein [Hydrotalea flava]